MSNDINCNGDFSYKTKCPFGSFCKSLDQGPMAGGICRPFVFPYITHLAPVQKNRDKPLCDVGNRYYSMEEALKNPDNVCFLQLSNLTKLSSEIKKFKNLRELHITATNHIRTLPIEIGKLSNLVIFNMMFNEDLETLPEEIYQLEALEQLLLSNNKIQQVPPGISSLKNLRVLRLDNNELTCLPREVGSLTNLEDLRLGGNNLTMLPPEIINLEKNLQILSVYHNPLILDQTPQAFLSARYHSEDKKVWKEEITLWKESAELGEGVTHLARKVIDTYLTKIGFFKLNPLTTEQKICLEDHLQNETSYARLALGETKTFSSSLLKEAFGVCQIKIENVCH